MANAFTPEQIAQILEEFFKTVGARQYIGARYVPIFGRKDETSIEWDNTKPYEPLTIVLYQGNSFTSRQYVPEGVEITNQEFWAITGNYNAQVEQYRRETAQAKEAADAAQESADNAQNDIDTLLPKTSFSAEDTVKDAIDAVGDIATGAQNAFDGLNPRVEKLEGKIENFVEMYPTVTLAPCMQCETDADYETQGGCVFNDYVCFGARKTGENNAHVWLRSLSSNRVVATNLNNQFGHCNDMCYNEDTDRVIVVGTDIGQGTYKIYELNPTTLAIVAEHTPTVSVYSIAYDPDEKVYYAFASGHMYKLSSTFEVLEDITIDDDGQIYQGATYQDNLIYILSTSSNSLDVYTKQGKLYNKVPIEYNSDIIELEFCDVYDGTLYIGCASQSEPFMCLYKTSVEAGNYNYNKTNLPITFYVDYGFDGIGDGSELKPAICVSAVLGLMYKTVTLNVSGTTKFRTDFGGLTSNKDSLVINGVSACIFNQPITLYGNSVIIRNCTFGKLTVNSKFASFNGCTFNYDGQSTSDPSVNVLNSLLTVFLNSTFNGNRPYTANISSVKAYNCTYSETITNGSATDAIVSQPYRILYNDTDNFTKGSTVNVPDIKAYRVFGIELQDTSDTVRFCGYGFITPSNNDSIRFQGLFVAASGVTRFIAGYINITNNLSCLFSNDSTYKKGESVSNDIKIMRIYGIA